MLMVKTEDFSHEFAHGYWLDFRHVRRFALDNPGSIFAVRL